MSSPRRRRAGAVAVVVILLLAAVAAAFGSRRQGRATTALDPGSAAEDGTKAMATLLRDRGLVVQVTPQVPAVGDAATVLVLSDDLGAEQRQALLAFVDGGGSLVVSDPTSALHPGADRDGGAGAAFGSWPRQACTIGVLAAVDGLDLLSLEDDLAYPIGPDDRGCFGTDRRAFVVERAQGQGRVTALGGSSPFLNRQLAEADNAALALALLDRDERGTVVFLQGEVLAGDKTLTELVPRRVWMLLAQLVVAFLALAWWRSRRLGAPVSEHDPVVVPGSELVLATGALASRSRHVDHSATVLRGDGRRRLCERLGVASDTPTAVLDDLVSARTGAPSGTVTALLDGPVLVDDDALVGLAHRLDQLCQEVS